MTANCFIDGSFIMHKNAELSNKFDSVVKRHNPNELKKFIRSSIIPLDDNVRQELWLNTLCERHKVSLPSNALATNSAHDTDGDTHLTPVKNVSNNNTRLSGSVTSLVLSSSNVTLPFIDSNFCQSFMLNDLGKSKLHDILKKIWQQHPDIVYAPMIHALTALLLHYLNESNTLYCLEILLNNNNKVKPYYLQLTKQDWQINCKMLQLLMEKHCIKMSKYLKRDIHDDSSAELMRWMCQIFSLPLSYLVRIMDCYLMEGFKVFYRAGIILIRTTYKHRFQTITHYKRFNLSEDLSECVANIERLVPLEQFVRQMFSIRFFSVSEVRKQISYLLEHTELLPIIEVPMLSITPVDFSHVENTSEVLNNDELAQIYQWLPQRIALCKMMVLFNTNKDGTSLRNLFHHCGENEPTVLLVETQCNHLFGAYCSSNWEERHNNRKELTYFGTGESFVFSLRPKIKHYVWVGKNGKSVPRTSEWYMAGSNDSLIVGGGPSGQAIRLDDNLNTGSSKMCETFENPGFAAQEKFIIKHVVVLGFESI